MEQETEVSFSSAIDGVDWCRLKEALADDQFDNGRSPEQLRVSFRNSAVVALAWANGEVVGTARALSDGVCNAYVVDVWTRSRFRGQGVATRLMGILMQALPGQHVYLFSDDAAEFYKTLGFQEQPVGLGCVVGEWLTGAGNESSSDAGSANSVAVTI